MNSPQDIIELGRKLNAQHPDTWTEGAWYPAVNPMTGKPVQIRRSRKVGAATSNFLHVRWEVPRVIVDQGTGRRTPMGTTYIHVRINLVTGDAVEL